MYRVLVADDEPMSLQMIVKIVNDRCPEYDICDCAVDGREALEKIRQEKPDVVITDIKMPLVSGVRVSEIIHSEMPNVFFVIISGYQSFEYAQRAIRSGAADYILKPITPSGLKEAMEKLSDRIRLSYYSRRNRLLHQICNGSEYDLDEMKLIFPYQSVYLGLIRENGLPRRFSKSVGREIYSDINEHYMIYGRDEREALYLIPPVMLGEQTIEEYLQKVVTRQKKGLNYQTIIYSDQLVSITDLADVIRELYNTLAHFIVIGKNQIIKIDKKEKVFSTETESQAARRIIDEVFFTDIEAIIRERKFETAKKKIKSALLHWQKQGCPQSWMEYAVRNLNSLCIRYGHVSENSELIDREIFLDDAFYNATSIEDLSETVIDILFQNEEVGTPPKLDSPEFLQDVLEYLSQNIEKSISLSELCRMFGVSQTYLSRLFRKYTGLSFNQKLTELRMEKAKRIINENRDFYIREVAEMVGYQDQFYFSRVFRSYVGKSPSEYADELEDDTV